MIIGIICEYNPFHNGHLYQINKIKEMYKDCTLIAIMSGNFTQRGNFSILEKEEKANIAVKCGIDLVVEIPIFYATQGADIFAYGAVKMANIIGCDALCFGSEHDDINFFYKNIEISKKDEYNELVKKYLKEGLNYPTATSKALDYLGGDNINMPNDILSLRYIKEIVDNNYDIKPIIIKRTNNFNDINSNDNIISANNIRGKIENDIDIKNYVPEYCYEILKDKKIKDINDYYDLIKYAILTNKDNLCDYAEVNKDIANRLLKWIYKSNSLEELVKNIKSKNDTLNKINRIILHILLNIKKEDKKNISSIKIVKFNDKGRNYLNKIKKGTKLISKFSDLNNEEKDTQLFLDYIYKIN